MPVKILMTNLLDTSLLDGWLLYVCYALGAALMVVLLIGSGGRVVRLGRWSARLTLLTVAGAVLGGVLGWLFSDVWNPVGVSLSWGTRVWLSLAMAGLGVVVGNLWGTRWWSKVIALVAVPVIVLVAALGVNADLGEYRTLRVALGGVRIQTLTIPSTGGTVSPVDGPLWKSWRAPPAMPAVGRLGTAAIPGAVSHFAARDALVYLPPAALVRDPPALPVMVVLSGQPGQPSDIVAKAGFEDALNSYAKAHAGLAPIVVIPDHLGNAGANPMCVDSPLGNSETYLTVDVPQWIIDHLGVLRGRSSWAIAGFSQGGTCAIQLGAGYPQLFGAFLDISGELAPQNGSVQNTVKLGFGGNASQYEAATPLKMLAAHAPYQDTEAIFAVGQNDARFIPNQTTLAAAARTAGMAVTSFEVPGSAHDWHCATAALQRGLDLLGARFGLSGP
jgi:S-formylglutathione hydrolase FrmB